MSLSTELRVGLLILTGAILVVVASITLTGWNPNLADTYQVHVLFDNVSGLQPRSAVRIAGIKVGSVELIELSGKKARVHLKMQSEYPIYQDSQATIKSIGILGDKYIELDPGNSLRMPLQDGDEIERILTGSDLDSLIDDLSDALNDIKSITGAMSRSFGGSHGEQRFNQILDNVEELTNNVNEISQVTNGRIEDITRSLQIFSKDLSQITQDNKQSIRHIVSNFQHFSQDLQVITTENRKNIQALVENLNRFSTSLANDGPSIISDLKEMSTSLAEDVPQITADLQTILSDNKKKFNSSMDNLDRAMANMKSISEKIDDGKGTVGKLINEEKTVEQLNSALENINKLLGSVDRTRLDLSVHAEFMSKNQSE
ncbi:MAG: MCE family protein, partial [SAR324 cluster bacterium]|nr:MCE family protein [SAR324 cluster bacterium]